METPAAWYAQGEGLRWWDGARWTGMRVKDGRPGVDWMTAEKTTMVFVSSGVFFFAGAVHLALAFMFPLYFLSGSLFVAVAVFWLLGGLQVRRVARTPAPTAAPVVLDILRPLPGEQEGPGAGWFPVSSTVGRWWTGTRWSQYTWTRFGIRPTFHGARSFRTLLWIAGGVSGLGAVVVIAGIVVVALAIEAMATGIGVIMIVLGAILLLLGVLMFALSPISRRPLVIPSTPPAPVPPAGGSVPSR